MMTRIKIGGKKALTLYILWFLFILFFVIFSIENNINLMFLATVAMLVTQIIAAANDFEGNIVYILFLMSCFLFMQGRYFVNLLVFKNIETGFSDKISFHIITCIFITLVFLHLAFNASNTFKIKTNAHKIYTRYEMNKVRKVTEPLFYMSAFVAVISNIDVILFVGNNSYLDYYLNYSSHLPRLLQVFGNMYLVFFWLYLCTWPKREKSIYKIYLYMLITFLMLISGDRGGFIQNIAILLVYLFWRQKNSDEVWIKKKYVIITIILTPVLMAFLSYFVYLREGIDVGELTISAQLKRFLLITGRTSGVIGYGKLYENQFPKSCYSLGGIIDYIKYNPISSSLFGSVKPKPQTLEYAFEMHSFDAILSYYVYPESYLRGHGLGSSYLAEAYHDFGYVGIILFSLLYGVLLGKCKNLFVANPTQMALILIAVRGLFYAPRGPAIIFITNILNITVITAFLIVFVFTKIKFNSNEKIINS